MSNFVQAPVPNPGFHTAALYGLLLSFYSLSSNKISQWGDVGFVLWLTLPVLTIGAIIIHTVLYSWAYTSGNSGVMTWLLKIYPLLFIVKCGIVVQPFFALFIASGIGIFLWLFITENRSGKSLVCNKVPIVRCFFAHCPAGLKWFFVGYMIVIVFLLKFAS